MATKREFYTTNQVAQTLGISPFTIRRYIHLRKLKAVKLEGSYRVRRGDLERFLKAREIETEDELNALEALQDAQAPAPVSTKRTAKPSPASEEQDAETAEPASSPKRRPPAGKKTARASKANASDQEAATPARSTAKKPSSRRRRPAGGEAGSPRAKDRTHKTQHQTPEA